MEEPQVKREVNKIQTFVFVDLEATGLPYDEPRILELSMIAVSRDDLINMSHRMKSRTRCPSTGVSRSQPLFPVASSDDTPETKCSLLQPSAANSSNGEVTQTQISKKSSPSPPDSPTLGFSTVPELPRVMHKYTRLYYPWKTISSKAEELTGLSNDALEHLPGFSRDSAQAILLFLDLPKPLTLVAHNGCRYDFRLLKAELNNVTSLEDFFELQCTDTLKAIKDIDALYEKEDIQEISRLAESFSMDDDMNDDLMEDSPPTNKRMCPDEAEVLRLSPGARHHPRANESLPQVNQGHHPVLEVVEEVPMTPVKEHPSARTSTPKTPHKPSQPQPVPITPESGRGFKPNGTKETTKVRRSLTYEGPGKRKYAYKMPYKQVNIYNRLFRTDYIAHRAESDCESLLQICGHYGEKFVEWADTFSERFAEVKPMWVKRKTFSVS